MFSSHRWILVLSALLACIITIGVSGFAGTATTTTLTSSLNPSVYGQDVTFTATVAPAPDGGTVAFKDGGTSIASIAVNTTTGKASFTTNSLSVGTHVITAAYSGTTNYEPSASNVVNQVVKRASKVVVFCADTPLIVNTTATGTVTITGIPDAGSAPPTGKVYLSHTGNGTLSPSTYTLQESDGGQFEFTYTPADGDNSPHVITASYDGNSEYAPGTDTFEQVVTKRAVDIQMSLSPTSAYVLQPVTITIHVEDDTTEGTPGSLDGIEINLDDNGKNGTFSDDTPTLDANGNCTAIYLPGAGDAGTDTDITTITASLVETPVYASKTTDEHLTVGLRPTETTVNFATSEGVLVNEPTTFTVTVKDKGGTTSEAVTPQGTLNITKSLSPAGEGVIGLPSESSTDTSHDWTYDYVRIGLDAEGADYDVITASYTPNDGIHTGSEGKYGKSISRRPTVTTIIDSQATTTGAQCTVKVEEDSGNAGVPSIPTGEFYDEAEGAAYAGISPPGPGIITKDVSDPDHTLIVNMTVCYKPNDRVHMTSVTSKNVDRSSLIPVDPGDGTDGSGCNDGCGDGGTDIEQMIFNMNAAVVALHATQMGLDAAATIASLFPDPVWTTGIVFESGTEIPAKDIVIAALEGTNQLLEVAIVAMETDLDGDGIPDVVEENTTHTQYNKIDSDNDGMDDMDEIDNAGGYYGGTRRPDPNKWDSDGDGLGDGDEADTVGTSFCVQDTDCDGVTDWQEYTTYADYDTYNDDGTSVTSSATARPDTRDQCEPLVPDTDGDGLHDGVEYFSGHLATDATTVASVVDGDGGYSPYVNDSDSDGDGIPDGEESTNGDAIWDGTLGGTGNGAASTGHGETHLCLADTDGDGLSDGEEVALFGSGDIHVITPYGTDTNPALDTDSDDDGLSDYEEVNVTNTDPLNYDTDGDGIWDVNELIATGGQWPHRQFQQISDPLDPDTDDDGLTDDIEYDGTGLGIGHGTGGSDDTECPYVNDDDSDDDGLQDGTESWDGNGSIDTGAIGDSTTQANVNPSGETDFCDPDTDGDGLTDGQEMALLGGLPVSSTNGFTPVTPQGVSTVLGEDGPALSPTIPALDDDSDNDGLSDYEEVNITHTDPLDADSDNDTLSDANELLCTGGTWPKRTFQQESDPLDPDTDDDDLYDQIEYPGTGMPLRSTGGTPDNLCPYVNDDDSDNDGLQDGVEDANHDGTWGVNGSGIMVGSFNSQAIKTVDYWETDLCNPDTDGDGILDGEEVSQLGGGPLGGRPIPVPGFDTVTPEGCSTVLPVEDYSGNGPLYTFGPTPGPALDPTIPALDVDSDNDGLSDYEEVNTTGTDPLDADSDNDTIMDADELIATGGTPGDHPQRTFDQESDPLDINTDDDYLPDPVEGSCSDPVYTGTGVSVLAGGIGGTRDDACPFVNNDDSDEDSIKDGAVIPIAHEGPNGFAYSYIFIEGFHDVPAADIQAPGTVRTVVTLATGEQNDDMICNVCDPDSDGDGLTDGEEVGLGTDPQDWDTDDDGRNDWHEVTGGGPIPTDPFDPDTDDDGLLDSAEVFGTNNTNPTNADTDGDGLCDGGTGTPYMVSGHLTVTVNPICKSCSTPGLSDCGAAGVRTGSADGIGDHPNPHGYGEDKNGNGSWDGTVGQEWQSGAPGTPETDPNQYDTDGDGDGDGVEVLGFSTSRQSWIPTTDIFGREITVVYPDCGCLEPLIEDTDGDGLLDGYEDRNHDGNFDFLPSEFDHQDPLPGPPIPYPTETNPCDPDTDHDDLTDYEERYQAQVFEFYANWDNDGDGLYNEDGRGGAVQHGRLVRRVLRADGDP